MENTPELAEKAGGNEKTGNTECDKSRMYK
jgi:hypothetical protein